MRTTLITCCLLLLINKNITAINNSELDSIYIAVDSISLHAFQFQKTTPEDFLELYAPYKNLIQKNYSSDDELIIFEKYTAFLTHNSFANYDSAHLYLIDALNFIEENEIKTVSTIYILQNLIYLNNQINNLDVSYKYLEKLKKYIGVFKYAEEIYIDMFYMYAHKQGDTTLILSSYDLSADYYSKTNDSLDLWLIKSQSLKFINKHGESIFYLKKILAKDTSYNCAIMYELIKDYEAINNKDSAYKYATLYLPYIENNIPIYAISDFPNIEEHILRIIINQKIERKDTFQLKELQSKYVSVQNPLNNGQKTFNIVKKEAEEFQKKENYTLKRKTYFFSIIFSLLLILSLGYLLNKKYKKRISLLSQLRPNISQNKEEEIKKQIEYFIIKRRFLDPSISQTKIVEDFNIGNVKYLSQTIKKEYGKKFPVFIKDLRINYLKENYEQEFKGLKKNEIATKLGFGSYRTFKDYIEKSYDMSITEFINKLD